MIITTAKFIQSNTEVDKLPAQSLPEYAFIGRSNVGKSSLINMLTGQKKLAKISSKPGKTITINHFLINENWYLVDLPGYGFAKRSRTNREKWVAMLQEYLEKRVNLVYLFVLIDSRIPPQTIDLEFINDLGEIGLPFVVVFTKTDKLSKGMVSKQITIFKNELSKKWEDLPPFIVTSSETGLGREEILALIESENARYYEETTSTSS
ncbi:MAG: ribosome biogenesis GTP-binding protein YihA/YsxC [Bacteroidetes bacterium]|nr:ribosome biogenesis GTP-binding protein YihA/YsxC [Bacteroidota bacterium]MBU1579062.1 ribosome biogenesis GTP-binding protein YihA/YsxC [Bacteroidota bacterium]MBU2557651.1 ribosome biogenesis GTP-binding protein YihA/YsxC [Bacteroidota bacterium]